MWWVKIASIIIVVLIVSPLTLSAYTDSIYYHTIKADLVKISDIPQIGQRVFEKVHFYIPNERPIATFSAQVEGVSHSQDLVNRSV
jgi:hypothetical protein